MEPISSTSLIIGALMGVAGFVAKWLHGRMNPVQPQPAPDTKKDSTTPPVVVPPVAPSPIAPLPEGSHPILDLGQQMLSLIGINPNLSDEEKSVIASGFLSLLQTLMTKAAPKA